MADFAITQAQLNEIDTVHKLAHRIWPVTFKEILSPAQIDYMMEMMYSKESLNNQMQQGCIFYLLHHNAGVVGFMSLEHGMYNTQLGKESRSKVHKIYVSPELHGKGAGRQLLDYASEQALEQGDNYLFLNVNRYNKAIGFYEYYGFQTKYQEDNDIGKGYLMEDFVMEKVL